jgi:hypothetical protein
VQDYWNLSSQEQGEIRGEEVKRTPQRIIINPCIALYGANLQGRQCRGCVHLRYQSVRSGAKHWKCDLRKVTNGSATDHRVHWDACCALTQKSVCEDNIW